MEPTARQQQVLDWITEYIAAHGYSPSIREIGDGLGITFPNGVKSHLNALRRKGRVTWVARQSRTLRVVEPEEGE